jgi:RNA 3'-terminal phosphate cyclase (ATP)
MIQIDGNYLEGGGQILRTSLSLSAILNKPFKISNIRSKRKNPGLQPQHLTAVRAMKEICNAQVGGDELHSTELTFSPGKIKGGKYIFDVRDVKESAGSVGLILQTVILPLSFSGMDSHIILRGGTHLNWSPCFEYLNEIFIPTVKQMGMECNLKISKYGYYPIGGGEIEATIGKIGELKSIEMLERGKLVKIDGEAVISNLPIDIAKREKTAALKKLVNLNCGKKIIEKNALSEGKGTFIFLKSEYEKCIAGFSSIGEIKKSAEEVGFEATEKLVAFEKSNAAIDEHLSDQIMIYAALAKGKTKYKAEKITNHLKTNAYTIRQFIPDVKIEIDETNNTVIIEGIGFESK